MPSSTLTSTAVSVPCQSRRDKEHECCQSRLPSACDIQHRLDRLQLGSQHMKVVVEGVQVALVGQVADKNTLDAIVKALLAEEGVTSVATNGVSTGANSTSTKKLGLVYNVKEGDTLFAIAQEIYGDGQRYSALFNANRDVLNDPNKIYEGQVLSVPTPVGSTPNQVL